MFILPQPHKIFRLSTVAGSPFHDMLLRTTTTYLVVLLLRMYVRAMLSRWPRKLPTGGVSHESEVGKKTGLRTYVDIGMLG